MNIFFSLKKRNNTATSQSGRRKAYTFPGVVLTAAIIAITVQTTMPLWETRSRHFKEKELEAILREYTLAAERFTRIHGRPPRSLEEMDNSVPRVLRRIYRDPFTNRTDWHCRIKDGKFIISSASDELSLYGTRYSSWYITPDKELFRGERKSDYPESSFSIKKIPDTDK